MEKKIKPTRLRVFNVFKAWIENHFEDWAENSELISVFRKFVEQKLAIEMKSAAQQLMKLLRDKVVILSSLFSIFLCLCLNLLSSFFSSSFLASSMA